MTSPSGPPDGAGGYPGPAPTQGYPPGAHAAPAAQQPVSASLQSEVHTLERAIFEVKRIIVGQDQLVVALAQQRVHRVAPGLRQARVAGAVEALAPGATPAGPSGEAGPTVRGCGCGCG